MTHARSPLRALRAALFAAVCLALAAMGHSFASGHDIPFSALLPALPVTAGFAWLAAARRRGAFSIGLGLLAAQGALHLYFAALQLHAHPSPTHHPGTPPPPGLPDLPGLLGPSPLAMITAHLVSAAFCAVWLARGEAAFLGLVRAAGALALAPLRLSLRLLLAVVRLPLPQPSRPPVRRRAQARPRRGLLLGHSLVRRGPPVCLAPRATALGAAV